MPQLKITDEDGEVYEGEVEEGTTLWEACSQLGCDLPHSCGFGGQCSTCAVTVLQGKIGRSDDLGISLTGMDGEELSVMQECGLNLKTQVLSCSSQIFDDAEVVQAGSEGDWDVLETLNSDLSD